MMNYKEKSSQIASIHFKVSNYSISGEKRSNEEKYSLVESMVNKLKEIVRFKHKKVDDMKTQVPYFDVSYEDIFPELELQKGSKFDHVSSNLHMLRDLFGFKSLRSLYDIEKYSFFPIKSCFPELLPKLNPSSVSNLRTVDNNSTTKSTVSYVLDEPSRIISDTNAYDVLNYLINIDKEPASELSFYDYMEIGVRQIHRWTII